MIDEGSLSGSSRPTLLVLASTYPRWAGDPEPGFVHELAKRLTQRFRVIALVPHAPGARQRETFEGVEVVRYRYAPERLETLVNDGGIVANLKRDRWKWLLLPTFVLAQAWGVWCLCRREKVDVLHAHWLIPQGLVAALLQLLPGRKVPFVVTSHGADLYALRGRALQALKRWVLARASRSTVVSSAMRETVAALGADVGKVAVLPMGVDLQERFVPDETLPRSRSELLFVGRLVEKKGLRHLLDALPEVLRVRPDVTLTVAGFGPDEAKLKAQVAALGIGHAVRFLGAVPQAELPALYRRAALFVAPFVQAGSGDQEGLGLVLVEAIGCGCPVLAGDVPAVRDVLSVDPNECLVDPRDAGSLAAKVLRAIERREQTMAQAAKLRALLLARLDWASVAHRYADLLAGARPRLDVTR